MNKVWWSRDETNEKDKNKNDDDIAGWKNNTVMKWKNNGTKSVQWFQKVQI